MSAPRSHPGARRLHAEQHRDRPSAPSGEAGEARDDEAASAAEETA